MATTGMILARDLNHLCHGGSAAPQGHAASIDTKGKHPVMAGEVWGLDAHPFRAMYATASDDRSIRLWSCEEHRLIGIRKLKVPPIPGRSPPQGRTLKPHLQDSSCVLLL